MNSRLSCCLGDTFGEYHETETRSNDRNYMAQDIMRRILRDFFGYEVNFVMNITDVDDKVSPYHTCPV